jgi:hypothetical protein
LVVVSAALVVGVGGGLAAFSRAAGPAQSGEAVTVDVGDVVSIAGTNMRCKVTRRHRSATLECIRADRRARTYGVLLSGRSVQVFRFDRRKVAHVVFSATQGSTRATVCGRRC